MLDVEFRARHKRRSEALEILEYIKAYPKNFVENLEEGIFADEEQTLQLLEDFAEWDSVRLDDWRGLNDGV